VPTYQYACTDCADRTEVVQKFSDDPLTACSTCGGKLRKVFSPVGIVFKGSGFYRTDSRNGSGKDKKAADGSDQASPAKADTAKGKSDSGSGSEPAPKGGEAKGKSAATASSGSASSSGSSAASGSKVA
jgi:putative FmdB family regulatory protein